MKVLNEVEQRQATVEAERLRLAGYTIPAANLMAQVRASREALFRKSLAKRRSR